MKDASGTSRDHPGGTWYILEASGSIGKHLEASGNIWETSGDTGWDNFFFVFCWRPSAKQAAQPLMQSINASTQWEPQKAPNHEQKKNEQTGQTPKKEPYSTEATQAKTQESQGEATGNDPGHPRERDRTNRTGQPARTKARLNTQQLRQRPKQAMVRMREQDETASRNKNEQERTRTNKRQQGLVEYQGEPRSKALPSPSDRGHREQGSGKLPGSRREGRALPSPSGLARLQQGHREPGSGQPTNQTDGQTDGQTAQRPRAMRGLTPHEARRSPATPGWVQPDPQVTHSHKT